MELQQKLTELKRFKTELNLENRDEFDKLIDDIKDLLSEQYKDKINILSFYQIHEKSAFEDDLPF